MTWLDLAQTLIPDESDEVLDTVLWNHTAFPCTYSIITIAQQLIRWASLKDQGLSECCICGDAYASRSGKIVIAGECGNGRCLQMKITKEER